MKVFTIGYGGEYGGRSRDEFPALMGSQGVKTVVDSCFLLRFTAVMFYPEG